ncbi:TetR/AcrR family transcriptional regulator [Ferrimonas sp. SCSIO 43195]|uniref:TetR/AcrR family transcriptional regulator n=1 Tax=Ferrimonas sp. SCSIO 43195 TaxID=2822844 RepID=UPI002074B860|nr:TetR family transcriptional regulator [Ferrimonas sp. SCSIO 43195]USD37715.1 TetR family transcriptional regulator [Ferrimonas sp. SCSIO 43195]
MLKLEREAQLLEVARELILEEGMVSFSFVEIAKRAGISRATLYKHFSGKEDVLVGLFIKDANSTRDMMVDIQNDPVLNDREKLITALLTPVSIAMGQRNLLGITFLSANPGIYSYATESRRQDLEQLMALLRQVSMQFWFAPIASGTLKASKEQVLPVMASVYPYQRGCVMITQNVMSFDNQIGRSLKEVFDNLVSSTEEIGWIEEHHAVSYEKILKSVGKYERESMIAC